MYACTDIKKKKQKSQNQCSCVKCLAWFQPGNISRRSKLKVSFFQIRKDKDTQYSTKSEPWQRASPSGFFFADICKPRCRAATSCADMCAAVRPVPTAHQCTRPLYYARFVCRQPWSLVALRTISEYLRQIAYATFSRGFWRPVTLIFDLVSWK